MAPRHRPAFVDVIRSAVVQNQPEIVIAPEGVVPRQPIAQHRRIIRHERQHGAHDFLIAAQHALRVDDALRRARGAGGEQKLRDGIRTDGGVRAIDSIGGGAVFEHREGGGAQSTGIAADHQLRIARHHGFDRFAKRRAGRNKNQPRRQDLENQPQLAEIEGNQRIGRRDRRERNARVHGAESERGMLQIVAGKNRDGPFGG